MIQRSFFIFFAFLLSCPSSYGLPQTPDTTKTGMRVLFIGNSLTYTNNLPQLVKENARLKGIEIETKMVAFPNYAIEDHWNDGEVQKLIASRHYDFVILQQGPSSQRDGREMLINYGKKYKNLCKSKDVQLCYFMVWPSLRYYHTFDAVIKNHNDAASINNAILLPVGQVWKDYIDTTSSNAYYSSDGFHPTLKGSQVAAEVIVEHLLQQ